MLFKFIYSLIGEKAAASKTVGVLILADLPIQTFVTASKLYRIIINRTNRISCQTEFPALKRRPLFEEDVAEILKDRYLIFLSCCMITSKYYRDISFTNESWVTVANIDKKRFNCAERAYLLVLDYQINVQDDSLVFASINDILKKSGLEIADQGIKSTSKFKSLIKKVLCIE